MEKTFVTRVKNKRDTSANWTSKNPVILNGEIILVDTAEGELRAKIGDGTKTYTQLPFSDEALRSLITAKADASHTHSEYAASSHTHDDRYYTKTEVDNKVSELDTSSSAPWSFFYDENDDVYGFEREVGYHTTYFSKTPYKITSTASVTNIRNAYSDEMSDTYALIPTSTTAKTTSIFIDTEMPLDADTTYNEDLDEMFNVEVALCVGATNISSAQWTTRTYEVLCGGVSLGSGTFDLSTSGKIIYVDISGKSLTSSVIEIRLVAQTNSAFNIKLFGASVCGYYGSSQERVTLIRQNQLAVGSHVHSEYADANHTHAEYELDNGDEVAY